MSTFGAVSFPMAARDSAVVAGDTGLWHLGNFLQAAVNRVCNAKWGSFGVCPGRDTVEHVFLHDPSAAGGFHEGKLPALYLWRGDGTEERLADDVTSEQTRINVGWIAEGAQPEHFRKRDTMKHAIAKAIRAALLKQRDPAWIVSGDTDPAAAGSGSLLNTWTGFEKIWTKRSSPKAFTFERIDDSKPLPYYGFTLEIDIVELCALDSTVNPNTAIGTLRTNLDPTTDQTVTLPLPA